MKKKVWTVNIDLERDVYDEDGAYAECDSWLEAVLAVFAYVEKDLPFSCTIDFVYRDGE